QSRSSQRSPGEFLKRFEVAHTLSISHSGAACYGSDICRARSGGRLAARSFIRLVIKDEDFEVWRWILCNGSQSRKQHEHTAIGIQNDDLAMWKSRRQSRRDRNVVAHTGVKKIAVARAYVGPFLGDTAQR